MELFRISTPDSPPNPELLQMPGAVWKAPPPAGAERKVDGYGENLSAPILPRPSSSKVINRTKNVEIDQVDRIEFLQQRKNSPE